MTWLEGKRKEFEDHTPTLINGKDVILIEMPHEELLALLEEAQREAWVDGFMRTGEGYNGEYCSGHGGNYVTREDVYKIYDEETIKKVV